MAFAFSVFCWAMPLSCMDVSNFAKRFGWRYAAMALSHPHWKIGFVFVNLDQV